MKPYYEDEMTTLYFGDCREILIWKDGDLLLTDSPYGRSWRQGNLKFKDQRTNDSRNGIKGDESTQIRDWILEEEWGSEKRAAIFGDLMLPPPIGTKQVLVYENLLMEKRGATGGFRRDAEAIYLLGKWHSGISG